jgi:hypothetical protein
LAFLKPTQFEIRAYNQNRFVIKEFRDSGKEFTDSGKDFALN